VASVSDLLFWTQDLRLSTGNEGKVLRGNQDIGITKGNVRGIR